ncbi:MAG: NUDIX hydrolase [Limnochordaceae bacterium]|nr:NUDIX hydrolase [Limnochordaceae bacterium]
MELRWVSKEVRLEDGTHVYHLLDHPGSVALVAVRDGRVALIRQYRPAVDAWLWEIPAGTLEPGEAPMQAARRELEEETGWQAGSLEELAAFYLAPGYSSERMHLIRAQDLRPGRRHLDAGEVIGEVRWFTPRELREMARNGMLSDAKTLAALAYLDAGADAAEPA